MLTVPDLYSVVLLQSLRMVTACFLTEYLNISWVEGARWYHDTLVRSSGTPWSDVEAETCQRCKSASVDARHADCSMVTGAFSSRS